MQSEKNFVHWGQWRKSCIHSLFQSSNYSVPGILKEVKPTWSFCDPYPLSVKAEEKEWACFPPLWTASMLPLFQSAFSLLSHLLNNLCQGSATAQIKWPLTTIIQKYFYVSSRFTQGTPASHAAIPHWHTNSSWIWRHSCDIHMLPICSLWRSWGNLCLGNRVKWKWVNKPEKKPTKPNKQNPKTNKQTQKGAKKLSSESVGLLCSIFLKIHFALRTHGVWIIFCLYTFPATRSNMGMFFNKQICSFLSRLVYTLSALVTSHFSPGKWKKPTKPTTHIARNPRNQAGHISEIWYDRKEK